MPKTYIEQLLDILIEEIGHDRTVKRLTALRDEVRAKHKAPVEVPKDGITLYLTEFQHELFRMLLAHQLNVYPDGERRRCSHCRTNMALKHKPDCPWHILREKFNPPQEPKKDAPKLEFKTPKTNRENMEQCLAALNQITVSTFSVGDANKLIDAANIITGKLKEK